MKNLSKILIILAILILVGVAIGFAAEFLHGKDTSKKAESNNEQMTKLAQVEDEVITLRDINETFNFDSRQLQGVNPDQLYQMLLEQMIGQTLIDQEAQKEISDRNAELREQLNEAKKRIKRNIYLEEFFAERITDKDMVMAYKEYTDQIPESTERQIRARHILVEDKATAEDIIDQLGEGADFAKLAMQMSTDPAAQNGGDLGFFSKNQMVAAFAEAAFDLDIGEYSDEPVETKFGWHVIMVEAKRVKPKPAFEEVRGELETQLRQQVLDAYLEELRNKYDIKRFDPMTGEEVEASEMPASPNPMTSQQTPAQGESQQSE